MAFHSPIVYPFVTTLTKHGNDLPDWLFAITYSIHLSPVLPNTAIIYQTDIP